MAKIIYLVIIWIANANFRVSIYKKYEESVYFHISMLKVKFDLFKSDLYKTHT